MGIDAEIFKKLKIQDTTRRFGGFRPPYLERPNELFPEFDYIERDMPYTFFDGADVTLPQMSLHTKDYQNLKRNRPDLTEVFALATDMLNSPEDFMPHGRVVHNIQVNNEEFVQSENEPLVIQHNIVAEYTGPRVAERFVTTQLAFLFNYALTGNSYGSDELSFQPDENLGTDLKGMRQNHEGEIFPESMRHNAFSTLYVKKRNALGDISYIPLFYITNNQITAGLYQPTFTLEAHALTGLRNASVSTVFGARYLFDESEIQGLSKFLTAYFSAGFPVVSLLQNEQGIIYPNPFNSDAEGYVPAEFFKSDPAAHSIRNKLAELVVLTKKSFQEANRDMRLIVLIDQLTADLYYSLLSNGIDLQEYQRPERLESIRPWEMVIGISRNIEYMLNATNIRSTIEEMANHLNVISEVESDTMLAINAKGTVPDSDIPFWVLRQIFATLEKHLGLYDSPDEQREILRRYGFSTDTIDSEFR